MFNKFIKIKIKSTIINFRGGGNIEPLKFIYRSSFNSKLN